MLSLNITLLAESAPGAFQSTPISLRWAQNDPIEFSLGAFTTDKYMAASVNQVVENFITDRIVNMTFNCTSPFGKDCILLAWLPQAQYVSDILHLASFLRTISDLVIILLKASRFQY